MTEFTIVRHGETEWNKNMRLQGFTDSPLTKKGIKQAELLGKELRCRQYDVLIVSDLYRAEHTARILNQHFNLEIIKNIGLRERSFGIMEGLTREEIEQKYAETYHAYMKRKSTYEIPKGESLVRFYNRVITALEDIINQYKNRKILIVSHGGVLDCVIRHIFHLKLDDSRNFTIYNTSVNSFIIKNNKWILEEWGNINHLKKENTLSEFS